MKSLHILADQIHEWLFAWGVELRTPHRPNRKQCKPPGRPTGVYFTQLSAWCVSFWRHAVSERERVRVCAWNTSGIRQWAIALSPPHCTSLNVAVFLGLYWITACVCDVAHHVRQQISPGCSPFGSFIGARPNSRATCVLGHADLYCFIYIQHPVCVYVD